jgi:hypothetical protein
MTFIVLTHSGSVLFSSDRSLLPPRLSHWLSQTPTSSEEDHHDHIVRTK